MMSKPQISVIMTVYNNASYLDESISSILNQTLKDFEFIIIDDCSSDESTKIVKKYQNKDARIKFIQNKKNLGIAKSSNIGLILARGKYVARLDSDDVSLPNRLEAQYKYLEDHQDIFLVGGQGIDIDSKGTVLGKLKKPVGCERVMDEMIKKNCIIHPSVMFRSRPRYYYRSKLSSASDYDFYLQIMSDKRRIDNVPATLVKYRRNPNSISLQKAVYQRYCAEKSKELYFEKLKTGKSSYKRFNPKEISLKEKTLQNDALTLECQIGSNYALNDLKNTRQYALKYFKHHGLVKKPKFVLIYISTFLPVKAVQAVKKVI
jgi:glycosyltransferase involved in cell wall biosynthesis